MAGTRNVRLIVTLCHNQNQRPEQAIDKESAKTEPRLGRMRRQRSSHQAKSQGMLVQRNPKHPACQARRSVERKSFSLLLSPFNRALASLPEGRFPHRYTFSTRPQASRLNALLFLLALPRPFPGHRPSSTDTASRYRVVAKAATPGSQNITRWPTWR